MVNWRENALRERFTGSRPGSMTPPDKNNRHGRGLGEKDAMSASAASLAKVKDLNTITVAKAGPVPTVDDTAKLAVAVEALSAIAGENDLTCLRALFRMRRRAEEALLSIRGMRPDQHTLF